jgi:hypothetical protein
MAYYFRADAILSALLESIASLPILASIVGFIYFMLKSPEKLQSEDYQLRHETLELIKQKGSPVELLPSTIPITTNPQITGEDEA